MKETESSNYEGSILTRLGGTGQDRRAEILSRRLDLVNWFIADPRQRYCQLSSRPKYIPEVDI